MNFFKVFSIFFLSRAFEIPVEHRLRTNAAMMAFRAMKNAEIPYNRYQRIQTRKFEDRYVSDR